MTGGILALGAALSATATMVVQETPSSSAPERPCQSSSRYAKFDFWVGEWEVYVADDKAGTNRIEESSDGGQTWSVWFDGRYVRRK